MKTTISRRALLAGAPAMALAVTPATATHQTPRMARLSAIVRDLRGISDMTPCGTYEALRAVANRIERDLFGIEPEPLPEYVESFGPEYAALFAKIGGAS